MLRCDPRVFRLFGVPREFERLACSVAPDDRGTGELDTSGYDTDAELARLAEAEHDLELEFFFRRRDCTCR